MSIRGIVNLVTRGKGTMLEPGTDAPDFDVLDHHRNRVRLRDLRGQKVVLWFYPKADTPG
jgi:peroxiredoxin Q/BCP